MKINLYGGFGEKGRVSVGVETAGLRLLLDVGIKVGAAKQDYHPLIAQAEAAALDALFISHAHEDHVGGLPWLLARGFRGRIFMTTETAAEAPATLAAYADPADLARFPFPRGQIELFSPGDEIALGDLRIATGRSGHVVGGVWFAVKDASRRLVYTADIVPDSGVFAMDATPACDLLLFDASYGVDPVSGAERAAAIAGWITAHPQGALLPTPLYGRSLELIAAMPGAFAVHASMRPALAAQIAATEALRPNIAPLLAERLAKAADWRDGEKLPPLPLLCHDGMGQAGPAAALIPRADAESHPVLLTGHLPPGSPADELHRRGRADWIRMPTHPTLPAMIDLWEKSGRPRALGHSCEPPELQRLSASIAGLSPSFRTGDSLSI